MSKKNHQYFASDRELYDLLMSGKQRITESVLLNVARSRGVFYSPRTSREDLVASVAVLSHDYKSVESLLQRREPSKRSEKTTSLVLDAGVSSDEIKKAVQLYQEGIGPSEKVKFYQKGLSNMTVSLEYEDIDHSKTRLIQRQEREAEIEIIRDGEKTIVRMPATPKSKLVVDTIISNLESIKKVEIRSEGIELRHLSKAEERTKFFTDLISQMPNYDLVTVTSLRVTPFRIGGGDTSIDLDIEDEEGANEQMLSVVRSVFINGDNLVSSSEYQDLIKRGFYIYGIKWKADQNLEPFNRTQFEATFNNAADCTELKYAVSCASQLKNGGYSTQFKQPKDTEKAVLFQLIENTAKKIVCELTNPNDDKSEDSS